MTTTLYCSLRPSLGEAMEEQRSAVSWELWPESTRTRFAGLLARIQSDLGTTGTDLAPRLGPVLAASDYVVQMVTREPEFLTPSLSDDGSFRFLDDVSFAKSLALELQLVRDEQGLRSTLRRIRHRELIRIAGRDLSGVAALHETFHDLSRLADGLVGAALEWLEQDFHARFGVPEDLQQEKQRLVVLGLGKLGGGELNFSSDIDLIFAYRRAGRTRGTRAIDNQEFFTRLGRSLIAVLSETTADGFCYRVDMRLRPFGNTGPLVMHFDALEDYYQAHGREWERYALIKARVIAGDRDAGEHLMRKLQPFIYRRYLDYGAFDNLRELKDRINRESIRKDRVDDIKHGEGGIREVEFVAQVFQLIRGGRDQRLQRRDLLGVMQELRVRRLLPEDVVDELVSGYRFLRRVENRLQMQADQQTHRIPRAPEDRERLALSLGATSWDSFTPLLQQALSRIHHHFGQVFFAPQQDFDHPSRVAVAAPSEFETIWAGGLGDAELVARLEHKKFSDPTGALEVIRDLRQGPVRRSLSPVGMQRLDRLMPLILEAIVASNDRDALLLRVLALIKTIARRSVYLALLVENPSARAQLLRLCEASPWISEQLRRFPVLLDELLDPRVLYSPPGREGLQQELDEELGQFPLEDEEQVLERLRQFKQVQTLRVAAADITGSLPLMRVSDHLTWLAEVLLQKVLDLSWSRLAAKHGEPFCGPEDTRRPAGFAIVGYGKLGGLELGYGSDLDIVFLHDSAGPDARTTGPIVIDNGEFFARLAQRMVLLIGAYTPAGRLYEVDTRLRPSGASGLLVSSLEAFERYQREAAWTWEHQALTRARVVAGSPMVGQQFDAIRARILGAQRDLSNLRAEVCAMREKMLEEHGSKVQGVFDLKRDRGGITDIEFMVQYWILAHAHAIPSLVRWSDKIRSLETLGSAGVIAPQMAERLADAYRQLRNRIHRLTLAGQDPRVDSPDADLLALREVVEKAWESTLAIESKQAVLE
jgi:glutamate-ammonia-ligase adenylyltransferase